jgi:hypothetical protein
MLVIYSPLCDPSNYAMLLYAILLLNTPILSRNLLYAAVTNIPFYPNAFNKPLPFCR